jgi:hypothetical protein
VSRFDIETHEKHRQFDSLAPNEPTPEIRMLRWSCEAADGDDAERQALNAWDEKYDTPPEPPSTTRVRAVG